MFGWRDRETLVRIVILQTKSQTEDFHSMRWECYIPQKEECHLIKWVVADS
jgi:hypothetical protein